MSERVWTPEMIDTLKRLRARGRTFGQIARMLGVTRSAAIGKAMRLGLRTQRPAVRAAPVPEPTAVGGTSEILGAGVCHWIAGDVGATWQMCGHKSVSGRSWCAHHLARVYSRAAARDDESAGELLVAE